MLYNLVSVPSDEDTCLSEMSISGSTYQVGENRLDTCAGLSADKIHAELVERSLQDERLHPLLPLLGVERPPTLTGTDSKRASLGYIPAANSVRPQVQTEPFKFPNEHGETYPLEDWEVHVVVSPKSFKNWVALVEYEPACILVVRSLSGVRTVIKWARSVGKGVRGAGFRHTWSPLYSSPEDVVITFIPPNLCAELPYEDPPPEWHSELQGVTIVDSVNGVKPSPGYAFAKVMAGTTNNQFREWCHTTKSWALPFNTVVLAVTFGGTNATICHGAGLGTSTLSDLVLEVCYVDADGNDQCVKDPVELKAAAGCFGMLGIVTSITIQMEKMTVAEMRPTQVPVVLAIPPPHGFPIPPIIQAQMKEANITDADVETARLEWIRRCEEDHFHEWFWFPFQKNAWVNTWKRRPWKPEDASLPRFPEFGIKDHEASQLHSTFAASIAGDESLSPTQQAYSFGLASLASLPNISADQPSMTTYISEGLHFRGGSQNFPFWGMEWELPIRHVDGKRDYAAIQRAWWDGISAIYSRPDAPLRAALEMRLTGGSSILLAPQRGNESTASIEVFTTLTTPPDAWKSFRQLMVDHWTSYKDDKGEFLNARPHWAKHWWDLEVRGESIQSYVKETAYKEAFTEFRALFTKIVERRGGSVEDTRKMFNTELMGRLIFD